MATTIPKYHSFNDITNNNTRWFSPENTRFFGTRVSEASVTFIMGGSVAYFVTSERMNSRSARRYSVRRASFTPASDRPGWYVGEIDTVGAFHAHATKAAAVSAMRAAIAAEIATTTSAPVAA